MNFTAKDVAALREKTGCGMMDCKKALAASDGNVDAAIDLLREKGLAAVAKKAGRIAAEGVAYATVNEAGDAGVVIEVNSETDFVAKNAQFRDFVELCAKTVMEKKPADVEALLADTVSGGNDTVAAVLQEKVLTIGENLKIRRFTLYDGKCVAYNHANGRIGVLLKMEIAPEVADQAVALEAGRDVAMQIAAMNPLYLDKTTVPAEALAKEKEIVLAQIDNDPKTANKPAQIKEKMVPGKLNKFYETTCLMQQAYVKDGELTVEKYLAQVSKEQGGAVKATDFVRYEKGEGLEKRSDDFASEIASMVK